MRPDKIFPWTLKMKPDLNKTIESTTDEIRLKLDILFYDYIEKFRTEFFVSEREIELMKTSFYKGWSVKDV
jgi:hypothetical protein